MRNRVVRSASLIVVAGLLLANLFGPWAEPRASAGEADGSKRLLVRCREQTAQRIALSVRREGGQVWDLETMRPLERPSIASRGPAVPPAEALHVWVAIDTALDGIPVKVTEMTVQERRAVIAVLASDQAGLDAAARHSPPTTT